MIPDIWGPHVWKSMHLIAAGYPVKPTKQDMKVYKCHFVNMGNVLPCKRCGLNYKKHLVKYPIDNYLKSRKRLMYWVYLIHKEVNKITGKSSKVLWSDVYAKYMKLIYISNSASKVKNAKNIK